MQVRRGSGAWLAAAALLAVLGCVGPQPTTANVQLVVMLQGATANEVTRILVTVTASDLEPLTSDLQNTGGTWGGTLTQLPAGTGRTFTAEAFNAAGTKIFAGEAPNITLVAGQTAVVNITLQELGVPPDFENQAPTIVWLTASTDRVQPGGTVVLRSSAQDGDAGDTLTYAWTGTAGSFDAPTSSETGWTAPMNPGPVTLTVTVTDSKGASAALSLTLTVEGGGTGGGSDGASATVGAVFNAWPRVTQMTVSPSFLAVGETATLQALASDLDGDTLSYQWTVLDGCPGSLANATSRTASFTASPPPPPNTGMTFTCQVRVTATDGRGGRGLGTLRFYSGNKPTGAFPPRITRTTQSATTVSAGQSVTFSVTAVDPQSSPLSFQWQSGGGTLGTPVSGFATSEITWTAPSCLPASIPTVGVGAVVNNTRFLSAFAPLSVTISGPPCASPAWMGTTSMATPRGAHTATVLPSGTVLVVGGQSNAMAELYDVSLRLWRSVSWPREYRSAHAAVALPSGKVLVTGGQVSSSQVLASAEQYDLATDRWTPVASMLQGRSGHTATVLSSGKVLVTGGRSATAELSSAELYDPATNTWTAAGSMSQTRSEHSAVVLPSGKVMVVGRANTSSAVADVYDPVAGTWTSSTLLRARAGTKAVVLSSGKVLVVGGEGFSFSAELYDPATGTSTNTGSPLTGHVGVDPVLLPSGKVLLAGGGHDMFSGGNLAELYDPVTGTWSNAGTLSMPRARHTVSALPAGVVLVAGGQGSFNPAGIESAELYLP